MRRNWLKVIEYYFTKNCESSIKKSSELILLLRVHDRALNFELASQSDSKVPSVKSNLFLELNAYIILLSVQQAWEIGGIEVQTGGQMRSNLEFSGSILLSFFCLSIQNLLIRRMSRKVLNSPFLEHIRRI